MSLPLSALSYLGIYISSKLTPDYIFFIVEYLCLVLFPVQRNIWSR